MGYSTQTLATLIGSRICHDLISPVGAIQNGIELLAMEGRSGPEMSLIEDSVNNASARIRFMRVAFGLAGEGQSIGRPEIDSILRDMSRAGRVRFDWAAGVDCPRKAAQEVFLALMCMESAMPRGGTISITHDGANWVITGMAEKDRPDPRLWQVLCGADVGDQGVLPAHVQFVLLPGLLNDRGARAEVDAQEDKVTLRLPA